MLHGKFSEGTAIGYKRKLAEIESVIISLPDDDGDAMELLCKVLHHQWSGSPTLEELKPLAVICDKYQCSKALNLWSTSWLQNVLDNNCLLSAPTLVALAYMFDNALMFHLATKALVESGSLSCLDHCIQYPAVPAQLIDGKTQEYTADSVVWLNLSQIRSYIILVVSTTLFEKNSINQSNWY
jgi:hypothetical protein